LNPINIRFNWGKLTSKRRRFKSLSWCLIFKIYWKLNSMIRV